ncbi:MAG: 50S ribosomal protein L4 [Candidatus Micrarchaeia archaeon]|jgi:large subunit ribosomal protein L4e
MEANVYNINGEIAGKLSLPSIFETPFRIDLVRRALLAEQSLRYQPQGHYLLAGLQTTAVYVGRMGAYRSGRHMGIAIRPRQKLGGGAMGDVRRIPSAVKGRRAHPHKIEKKLVELINLKEYRKAIASAIGGSANKEIVGKIHKISSLPIVVEDKIESIKKTKDLIHILEKLGLKEELEKSHEPRLRKGLRRSSRRRKFRKSILIVTLNDDGISKASRNIPGVAHSKLSDLKIELLAPGAMPRIIIWDEGAVKKLEDAVKELKVK